MKALLPCAGAMFCLLAMLQPCHAQPSPPRVPEGALQALWADQLSRLFRSLLRDKDVDLRRLGADGLGRFSRAGDREIHDVLVDALSDQSPAVRRALLIAIGRIGAENAEEVVVNALQFDNDEEVREGVVRALELLGKRGLDQLHVLSDSGDPKDLQKVVDVLVAWRTRPGFDALPALLKNYHLTAAQKTALIRSYRNYRGLPQGRPDIARPVAAFLAKLPEPAKKTERDGHTALKLACLAILQTEKELKADHLKMLSAMLDNGESAQRLPVIEAIGAMRRSEFGPRLADMLRDKDRPQAERDELRRVQDLMRGLALDYWICGPFNVAGTDKVPDIAENKPDPSLPLGKLIWTPVATDVEGYLDASLAPCAPTYAFALTYVYSPREQKVNLLAGGLCGVQLWLNGKSVGSHVKAPGLDAWALRQEVTLAEGWNPLLLRCHEAGQARGVYVRFVGGAGVRVSARKQ